MILVIHNPHSNGNPATYLASMLYYRRIIILRVVHTKCLRRVLFACIIYAPHGLTLHHGIEFVRRLVLGSGSLASFSDGGSKACMRWWNAYRIARVCGVLCTHQQSGNTCRQTSVLSLVKTQAVPSLLQHRTLEHLTTQCLCISSWEGTAYTRPRSYTFFIGACSQCMCSNLTIVKVMHAVPAMKLLSPSCFQAKACSTLHCSRPV